MLFLAADERELGQKWPKLTKPHLQGGVRVLSLIEFPEETFAIGALKFHTDDVVTRISHVIGIYSTYSI